MRNTEKEKASEYVCDPLTATALEAMDGRGKTVDQAIMISWDLLFGGKAFAGRLKAA